MPSGTQITMNISVDAEHAQQVERLMEKLGFRNRSEFFRWLVDQFEQQMDGSLILRQSPFVGSTLSAKSVVVAKESGRR